jgi:integrase/recombinase XerD
MSDCHPIAPFVRRFLIEEVRVDRNLSLNTQRSYRDTIRMLFVFIAEHQAIDPMRLAVEQITAASVRAFLIHLKESRGNSIATCNQRLAALHSLFRFIGRQVPELVEHASQICDLPPRRAAIPVMAYLDKREIDALLAVPDRQRPQGRRDYALLLFLYNTGARASEAAMLNLGDLDLAAPSTVSLHGKGRKTRRCPLWTHTAKVLGDLLGARRDGPPGTPVFLNVREQPITRFGIHALVARTVARAATTTPSLHNKRVSPHTLRHTTAVHLLRAGVDINTIRVWLGHVSLETTNRYAEVDIEMKAAALEACAIRLPDTPAKQTPSWRKDHDLMAFLMAL